MPMTRQGKTIVEELPGTLQRSPKKAQDTFAKTHDAAVQQYGEGRRANQIAYGSLKHSFEKVGDHWEPKGWGAQDRPGGPAAKGGARSLRQNPAVPAVPAVPGVAADASKRHLQGVARQLGVPGRSGMNKAELMSAIDAIERENRRRKKERGR